LNWLQTDEFAASIAFRHSNDKTEAMKMYAGVHVFVCDNMVLSGDEIVMNRKHTTRFSLAAELTKAFDRYKGGALVLRRNIDDLKGGMLANTSIEVQLFEIFYRWILPARMLVPVTDSFYSQNERTDWALLNACMLHAKNLLPNSNMRAHTRLGIYFGLGQAKPLVC
jgi:hypothetical protein